LTRSDIPWCLWWYVAICWGRFHYYLFHRASNNEMTGRCIGLLLHIFGFFFFFFRKATSTLVNLKTYSKLSHERVFKMICKFYMLCCPPLCFIHGAFCRLWFCKYNTWVPLLKNKNFPFVSQACQPLPRMRDAA
jgi:hypothetical protein